VPGHFGARSAERGARRRPGGWPSGAGG